MKPLLPALVASSLLAGNALAQTDRVVPKVFATTEGNDLGSYPFGRAACRAQQIFDGSSLGTTNAIITGMAYRPDNDNSIGSSVTSFSSVVVSVSATTVSPAAMSTTFASNETSTPTTVFNGPLSLPAYTSAPQGIAPWSTPLPFSVPTVFLVAGNHLLVDVTTGGSTPTSPQYVMDTALPGGSVRTIGTTGTTSGSFDNLRLLVSANGTSNQGRYAGLAPAGSVIVFVQAGRVFSGEMMFGTSLLPTPFDLGPLGAPTNVVHVLPALSVPFTMVNSGIAIRAQFPLTVPADPGVVGARVYGQAFVADPPANSLGVVTTNAVELTVGEIGLTRQVYSATPSATTGTYLYVSNILGGPVVRFTGTFL